MRKRLISFFGVVILAASLAGVFLPQTALAAPCTNVPPQFGFPYCNGSTASRRWGTGYFTGKDYNSLAYFSDSGWAWPGTSGVCATFPGGFKFNIGGDLTNDFIARVRGDLYMNWFSPNRCDREKVIGAALIVDAMLGVQGPVFDTPNTAGHVGAQAGIDYARANIDSVWTPRVQAYNAAGKVNWDLHVAINGTRSDSVTFADGEDAGFYGNGLADSSKDYIRFYTPDGKNITINKKCGNITGEIGAFPALQASLVPSASPPTLDDSENPVDVKFQGSVTVNPTSGSVVSTATRHFYILHANNTTSPIPGFGDRNDSKTFTGPPTVYSDEDASFGGVVVVGDRICETVTVNPSNNLGAGAVTSSAGCTPVVAKPYVRVSGNDIIAGATWGNACSASATNPKATIISLEKKVGSGGGGFTYTGSGSQLAAFALGEILGFSSAINHNNINSPGIPAPNDGLTFGNFGVLTGNPVDSREVPNDGGQSNVRPCIPDYFNKVNSYGGKTLKSNTPGTVASSSAQSIGGNGWVYTGAGTKFTVAGSTNLTGQHVLAVNGNVYISGDITAANYAGVSNIPSLYIIATGNIYVGSNVHSLFGVFVAQPKGSVDYTSNASLQSTGMISDCATSSGSSGNPTFAPVGSANLYNQCNSQLTIDGSFIANYIQFIRAGGSLKNSSANETPSGSNAAEIFKPSVSLFLNVPAPFHISVTKTSYDSITSLPPVL